MQVLFPSRRLDSQSIREVVFGVEDGVVQNMTLVAGMVGGGLSSRIILFAGSINAVAGVLSMSMGTFLSSKAERDVAQARAAPGALGQVRTPRRDAAIMAGAYATGAAVPLLPFIVTSGWVAVATAVTLAAAALFVLGVDKAIASNQSRIRAGVEMVVLAAAAGLLGYLIGVAAEAVFDLDV